MNKALVLGASGTMGTALVFELASRGIEVIAFARNKQRLEQLFGQLDLVHVHTGDVFNKEELGNATADIDVIFHAVNIPFSEWQQKQPLLLAGILEAAKASKSKVVLVDNIYAYGKSNGKPISEQHPKEPHTKKGKIRLELESMAKESGVPVVIAHLPDFYGPHMGGTLLHYTFQAMLQNKKAMFVGNKNIAREYIYTPDGAKALVELSLQDKSYGENWNIPGSGTITGEEIVQIAKDYIGYGKTVNTVTKPMIRLLGLVDRNMREYVEMYYLNETPVTLNGEKYEREIGPLPRTHYKSGIEQTLQTMKDAKS